VAIGTVFAALVTAILCLVKLCTHSKLTGGGSEDLEDVTPAILKNMRNGDVYWDRELVDLQELEKRLTGRDFDSSSSPVGIPTLEEFEQGSETPLGRRKSIVYYREAPSAVPTPLQLDAFAKLDALHVEMEHLQVKPEWGRLESFELQQDPPLARLQAVADQSADFFVSLGTEEVQFALWRASHVTGLLDDLAYLISSHRVVETVKQASETEKPEAPGSKIQLRLKWNSGVCQQATYLRQAAPPHIITFCDEVAGLAKLCRVSVGRLPSPLDQVVARFSKSARGG
jgi:hypothetical protein